MFSRDSRLLKKDRGGGNATYGHYFGHKMFESYLLTVVVHTTYCMSVIYVTKREKCKCCWIVDCFMFSSFFYFLLRPITTNMQ